MATAPQIPPTQTPEISHRSRRKFELREADFGKDVNEEIKGWLKKRVEALYRQYEVLHKQRIPEYRRIASGKPKEEKKSWPFPNCANLVHQLVGQTIDDIAARVMGLVWATSPVSIYRYLVDVKDPKQAEKNSEKARHLEQFMDYAAIEPTELNLYPVENLWFTDSSRLGTSWVVVRPEEKIEAVYIGYDTEQKRTEMEEVTLYEGPRVQNVRFEDVLGDINVNELEDSDLVIRKVTLNKRALQERAFKKHYKSEAVGSILGKPDRYGPSEIKKRENQKKGVSAEEESVMAEWDIQECYFYWYNGRKGQKSKKYRLIVWYHLETNTVLNQVFNYIPDNQIPIVRTRLSNGEFGLLGSGYAEMLKDAQDEISTAKNQRTDAITWAINGVNRISPANKNIDRNFSIFPGVSLPFNEGEYEHFSVGDAAIGGLSLQNEIAMIQQAQDRAGVGPAVAGLGSGTVNKKGQYGSMGTLAVMQDNNTRANHRLSDFRHSHVKLMGLITSMYGAMGLGKKGSLFGIDDTMLDEAFTDFLEHRCRIPIRAATASANKEVEKQNDMLLAQALRAHHAGISQMMQAISNASLPDFAKKYFEEAIQSMVRMERRLMRNFGYDQPEEFVPDVKLEDRNAAPQNPGQNILQMANAIPRPGAVPLPSGAPGMGEAATGLPGEGR